MKRRIEITREHTTRIQLVQPGPAQCPQCRRPLALAQVEVVTVAELTRPQLEAALRRKGLAIWAIPSGRTMVCSGCVRDLLETPDT
jgi:hypothetical protein